jgi:hypothetical protein
LKIYFAQAGYKDGLHGLVLALFQSFYSFAVFAKFWEMEKFSERDVTLPAVLDELHHAGKETKYWMLTTQIDQSKTVLKKNLWKVKRKFL